MKENLEIIIKLSGMIKSKEFQERNKMRAKDFIRERKIPFTKLVYFLINIIKKSLSLEITNFTELFYEKETTFTKQAFSKSRRKLKPEAFIELNEELIKEKMLDKEAKKYKGYRVLAIDGSTVELPTTEELKREYGEVKNNSNRLNMAMGRTSMMYDVENELIIDGVLEKYKTSEREMAQKHINKYMKLREEAGSKEKVLILFDRGYPSLYMMAYIKNRGIEFVIRTTNSFLKETNEVIARENEQDEIIEIEQTKTRMNSNIRDKKLKEELKLGEKLEIRVLKFKLDSGEYEYLVSSLTDKKEIGKEMFKEIYFKRWGIETAYGKLKKVLEIENFTGKKAIAIKQDFNATILLNNIGTIIIEDAKKELEEEMKKKRKI